MDSKLARELLELPVRDVIGGAFMFCGLEHVRKSEIFKMFEDLNDSLFDDRWRRRVNSFHIRQILKNLEAWGFIYISDGYGDYYTLNAPLLASWRRNLAKDGLLPKFEPALKAVADLLKRS